MALLAVERIKLFSTRSPWWCIALALASSIGFAAMLAGVASDDFPLTVGTTEMGYNFGLMVVMVMAALAITTEYRFGTIKATFQAAPNRTAVLVSKAVVVSVLAGVVGEAVAFGSWGISRAFKPDAPLAIDTAAEWRNVAGVGVVYAVGAVLALSVGVLIRQTAGAVTVVLVEALLVENLVALIPKYGADIQKWMPFEAAHQFLTGGGDVSGPAASLRHMPFGPWGALVYFVGITIAFFVAAVVVARRRDA